MDGLIEGKDTLSNILPKIRSVSRSFRNTMALVQDSIELIYKNRDQQFIKILKETIKSICYISCNIQLLQSVNVI